MWHENFLGVHVIRYPQKLVALVAGLSVTLLFAALETIVVARAPWWRLPWPSVLLWSWITFLVFGPFGYWLLNARSWAYRGLQVCAVIWLVITAWMALRMRFTALAILCVFLGAYWAFFLSFLKRELGRSFFDPWMSWYMGAPRALPKISCELKAAGKSFSVSRLDEDGVFVIGPVPEISKGPVALKLIAGEQNVDAIGIPTLELRDRGGMGFEFIEMSPDEIKRLGDFVERLRGDGYVN